MENTAGAVFSYKRKDYLRQVLDSIYNANQSEQIDWHFYQDGWYNRFTDEVNYKQEILECAELARNHDLEFTKIHVNVENKDIALQKDEAHGLFDDYTKVMFFENDMVIGKHYLQNLYNLLEMFPEYISLQYNLTSEADVNRLNHICELYDQFILWGYGMTSLTWRKIEDTWNKYVELIRQIDYSNKDENGNTGLLSDEQEDAFDELGVPPEHDLALTYMYENATGNGKLMPVVSRGKYIGKNGKYSFNDSKWENEDYDEQPDQITFEDDPIKMWNTFFKE